MFTHIVCCVTIRCKSIPLRNRNQSCDFPQGCAGISDMAQIATKYTRILCLMII